MTFAIPYQQPQPRAWLAALKGPVIGLATALAASAGARQRRTLPRLTEAHPEASGAPRTWRGPTTVAVSAIVGTAAAQPGTRRADFRPSAGHEPAGWQLRWDRLHEAAASLAPLPPIEVLKAGDGYWVLDGHNRVALANATGQAWIDAVVTELVLPPAHATPPIQHGGIS